MVDTILLEERIEMSGKKRGYLAEKCGLSRAGLWKKIKGETLFTSKEIKILCEELDITRLSDRWRIFFADDASKNGSLTK